MSFLFTNLGRYLFLRTLSGVGIALSAVMAVILLVDVVEELRTVGARIDLSLWEAMGLTALKAPFLVEQTLPFAMLAGSMIAVIQLNRRSELVAMRASGVSAWRFLLPTIAAAVLLGLVSMMILNPLGARMFERFEAIKASLQGQDASRTMTRNGIWLRQGDNETQVVVHADGILPESTVLKDATFFFFEVDKGSLTFVNRIQAAEAELRPSSMWELRDYVEARPAQGATADKVLSVPTNLEVNALYERFVTPSSMSFWRLPGFIKKTRQAGLALARYELKQQGLFAMPMLMAAMAAIGAVFSLRLQRLGGVAALVMTGVAAGFLLYFSTQIAAALAVTEIVPPVVAAWTPPLTGLFGALAFLSFQEDG